jgi:hypothetical protein
VYDHFCPVLWADLGRDNYPYFILVTFMMSCVAQPTFMYVSLVYVQSKIARNMETILHMYATDGIASGVTKSYFHGGAVVHMLAIFMVWTACFWVLLLVIFIWHVYMMSMCLTSREVLNMSSLHYIDPASKRNRFHRGSMCANMWSAMVPFAEGVSECYKIAEIPDMLSQTQSMLHPSALRVRILQNIPLCAYMLVMKLSPLKRCVVGYFGGAMRSMRIHFHAKAKTEDEDEDNDNNTLRV